MSYILHDLSLNTFKEYRTRDSLLAELYRLYSKDSVMLLQNANLSGKDTRATLYFTEGEGDLYPILGKELRRWMVCDECGRKVDYRNWVRDIVTIGCRTAYAERRGKFAFGKKCRKHRCFKYYGRRKHSQHRNMIADSKLYDHLEEFPGVVIRTRSAISRDAREAEFWWDPRVRSEKGNCWKTKKCKKQWQKHKTGAYKRPAVVCINEDSEENLWYE